MIEKANLRELERLLVKVDPDLFLYRNRGTGDAVFMRYSGLGIPTGQQLAFVMRRGGREKMPHQLNGYALPTEGVHDWGNGWGCAVIPVDLFGSDEALCQFAVVFAAELSRKCTQVPA